MPPLRFGLLGWPVKHSVSPQMQGAGFDALDIDATYELIEVPPDRLLERVAKMVADGFRGWNITVPHKGGILPALDVIDPVASRLESVNTVLVRDGKLHGWSTDGYGLAMSIKESFNLDVAGNRFLFWGTGGAARATAAYFAETGAAEIVLVNRTKDKADHLATLLHTINPACRVRVYAAAEVDAIADILDEVDVVIQCTSVGLHVDDPISIPECLLRPGLPVLDMIYRPTRLLHAAAKAGCYIADGRGMLLHQGVRSFEIWNDLPMGTGPVDAMRHGLNDALADRG